MGKIEEDFQMQIAIIICLSVFQSLSLLSVTLYMKDLFKNAIVLLTFVYCFA